MFNCMCVRAHTHKPEKISMQIILQIQVSTHRLHSTYWQHRWHTGRFHSVLLDAEVATSGVSRSRQPVALSCTQQRMQSRHYVTGKQEEPACHLAPAARKLSGSDAAQLANRRVPRQPVQILSRTSRRALARWLSMGRDGGVGTKHQRCCSLPYGVCQFE